MEVPHASALRSRGLPRQFSSTATNRTGRRVEERMFSAGSRVQSGVGERGIAGGGS